MSDNQKFDQVQDAIQGSFVEHMPSWTQPYLQLSRFDRPVGAWLLFLPCLYGALIFGREAPIGHLIQFILACAFGAILMRGAGCTWNDFVDRKIDAHVERTKSRPLPSKRISASAALIWMGVQMLLSAFMLVFLSPAAIIIAISSLLVVTIYPFAKRYTHWPQIILGLALNWGLLVASVEFLHNITFTALALYTAMFFWTLFYDTIYAFQDIEDDALIGVKSSAQVIQTQPLLYLTIFISFISIGLILVAISTHMLYLILLIFPLELWYLLQKTALNNPQSTLESFRYNVTIGQRLAIYMLIIMVILPHTSF